MLSEKLPVEINFYYLNDTSVKVEHKNVKTQKKCNVLKTATNIAKSSKFEL